MAKRKDRTTGMLSRPMTLEDITCQFQVYGPLAVGVFVAVLQDPEASHKDKMTAGKEILDRAYGKAKQSVEVGGEGGGPLRFTFDGLSVDELAKIAKGEK